MAGYSLSDKLCYENCVFPCSDCTDGKPTECLSCFLGYSLDGNECLPDTTCTDPEACSCPRGYAFLGSSCAKCTFPESSHCATCADDVLSECTSCLIGYHLMDDSCVACPESCSNCENENYCLTCSHGYFMLTDRREPTGICEACSADHFCKTCDKSPSKCTSCV